MKENLRRVWRYTRERWAMRYSRRWYYWATNSRLEPVKRVDKMIHSRLYGLRNYFRHRITNAMTEGLNSRLDAIWRKTRGYRNKARYRLVISATPPNARGAILTAGSSRCFLHTKPALLKGPDHGVRQVKLPWAEPEGWFRLLLECFAFWQAWVYA